MLRCVLQDYIEEEEQDYIEEEDVSGDGSGLEDNEVEFIDDDELSQSSGSGKLHRLVLSTPCTRHARLWLCNVQYSGTDHTIAAVHP